MLINRMMIWLLMLMMVWMSMTLCDSFWQMPPCSSICNRDPVFTASNNVEVDPAAFFFSYFQFLEKFSCLVNSHNVEDSVT